LLNRESVRPLTHVPPRPTFICQNCGAVFGRWQGKCDSCGARNTTADESGGTQCSI
jgi:predicted ATP-dependent serine protease